jgi:hypothetical protein
MKEPRVPPGLFTFRKDVTASQATVQLLQWFKPTFSPGTSLLQNLRPAITTRMLFRMHSTAKQLLWASAVLVGDRGENLRRYRCWRRQCGNDRRRSRQIRGSRQLQCFRLTRLLQGRCPTVYGLQDPALMTLAGA